MYEGSYQSIGQDYLEHYGVKGMRWGIRRDRDRGEKRTSARKFRKAKRIKTPEEIARSNRRKEIAKRVAKRTVIIGASTVASLIAGRVGGMLIGEVLSELNAPPPTPVLSGPTSKIIVENVIRNNNIPQSMIPETRITENVIKEQTLTFPKLEFPKIKK